MAPGDPIDRSNKYEYVVWNGGKKEQEEVLVEVNVEQFVKHGHVYIYHTVTALGRII